MFDPIAFGNKLQKHRKMLNLTQNDVAEAINVSPQAVSKWENGDCLPDCWNLKQLGGVYGISLDILLDMNSVNDLAEVSKRIEQLATEFIWAASAQDGYSNGSIGDALWDLTKSIFFVEVGNKELQSKDKEFGRIRFAGPYGLKLWDDDGLSCTITQKFAEGFSSIDQEAVDLIRVLLTPEVFEVITHLRSSELLTKQELSNITGRPLDRLNSCLIDLLENEFIDYVREKNGRSGYRLSDKRGIVIWILLSAVQLVIGKPHIMSRYIE